MSYGRREGTSPARATFDRQRVGARSRIVARGHAVTHGQGFANDMSALRHISSDQLRDIETDASLAVPFASDAIISVNDSMCIVSFDRGAEQMFGWRADELVGGPVDPLLPSEYRAVHTEQMRRFAAEAAPARSIGWEGRVDRSIIGLRRSGERFPAHAVISKTDVAGRRLLTIVLRDLSGARQEEDAQRLLAEVGRLLSASLDFNETLEGVTGLLAPRLADHCVGYAARPDGGLERVTLAHEEAPDGKSPAVLEAICPERVEQESGHPVAAAMRAGTPLVSDTLDLLALPLACHGRALGALCLIGARAGRLGARDRALAEQIAARTALALENTRLYGEAREAVAVREQVLRIVAHDLRNPLDSIVLGAELLLSEECTEAQRAATVNVIRRAAGRMQRLTQDLLDVARLEAGTLRLELVWQAPGGLLAEAVELNQPLAAAKSLRIRSETPAELPPVRVDRERILQVLANLIGNAVKFSPADGEIVVSARAEEREVRITVADTGPGIPEEARADVFRPFWRARHANREGAGLGLTIARAIVELHGGRIGIAGEPGQGTEVWFTLPIAMERRLA